MYARPATKLTRIIASVAALTIAVIAQAQRAPTVTYSLSGSAGNWTLNFTLHSHFLGGEGNFYFFNVKLDSGRDITGSPASWDPNAYGSWTFYYAGATNTTYNNCWITNPGGGSVVFPGTSLSGFIVHCTDAAAPTSVAWGAIAVGGNYLGNDCLIGPTNPAFEGFAKRSPLKAGPPIPWPPPCMR